MAILQEVSVDQIDELLAEAVSRTVPLTVTVGKEGSWTILRSRALAMRDDHLLVEMPVAEPQDAPHEFVPAERIGVNFKLKHHKHIFAATVAGQDRLRLEDGTELTVLALVLPTRMQRVQRRAFIRADVPPGRIVRASFWLGGRESEPSGPSAENPVWAGSVTNISAGGFQISTEAHAADGLDDGDTVGVRIVFGTDGETIYADAQYRHAESDDQGRALLGFQFLGLTETPEGRNAMQIISAKVAEFQHAGKKLGAARGN